MPTPARATSPRAIDKPDPVELVRSLCHEAGNLLAAIRLMAHVLESEEDPADRSGLARDQQRLVAQSGALLGLVRPLVDAGATTRARVPTSAWLAAVERSLGACLHGDVQLQMAKGRGLADVWADADAIHHVLTALVASAVDASSPAGTVRVRARAMGRRVVIELSHDGAPIEREDLIGPDLRGSGLLVAVADRLLRSTGGRAAPVAKRGRCCVELVLAAAPPRSRRAPSERKRTAR